ncbi:cell division protein FtsL [Bacillus solimangrovi]|uniref:Cell division protein FtsL n=1 Tax=Bacillus solimangrovi TaxID=1305675 RepID=A0A1E5LIN5_9BACI|nr:cell division protein FtsL [Bacillus solimangrovi]OEH93944.1 cell division protein FtsL [Bacillus solimangrovi]
MNQTARQIQRQQDWQTNTQTQQKRKSKLKYNVTPGEKILYFLFSAVFACMCIFVVSNQALIYQYQSDIQQIERNIETLKKGNHSLQEKVSDLSKPDRILGEAAKNGLTIQKNNVELIP